MNGTQVINAASRGIPGGWAARFVIRPLMTAMAAGGGGRRWKGWAIAIVFGVIVAQVGVVTTIIVLAVSSAAPAAACPVAATESVSVMGPPLASVERVVSWWGTRGQPPRLEVGVTELVDLYYAEATAEGVRPELALAQAVHETGYFTSTDTAIHNYAGIAHPDGAGSGRRFDSPAHGVRAHVQLLRAFAEGNDADFASDRVAPRAAASATTLLELAGTWATDAAYGNKVVAVLAAMTESTMPADPVTADYLATCGGVTGAPVSPDGYSLPVDRSWFDRYPRWFTKPHHDYPAADIPVPEGTPIYAMVSGVVTAAPVGGNCGLGVTYRGDDGLAYVACHGSDGGATVGPGDRVSAGQLIMHSSWTGRVIPPSSAGTHLHAGIRRHGVNVCPQPMFVAIAEADRPLTGRRVMVRTGRGGGWRGDLRIVAEPDPGGTVLVADEGDWYRSDARPVNPIAVAASAAMVETVRPATTDAPGEGMARWAYRVGRAGDPMLSVLTERHPVPAREWPWLPGARVALTGGRQGVTRDMRAVSEPVLGSDGAVVVRVIAEAGYHRWWELMPVLTWPVEHVWVE